MGCTRRRNENECELKIIYNSGDNCYAKLESIPKNFEQLEATIKGTARKIDSTENNFSASKVA